MNEVIDKYIRRDGWDLRENANVSYSISGLLGYLAGEEMRRWGLSWSPAANEYLDGSLHLHDLNMPNAPYCLGSSLRNLMLKGMRLPLSPCSKPAKHFSALMDHISNYLGILSLEWAGAQSLSDFDVLVAPFVHFDGLDHKEVVQNLQKLIFNLNYPNRYAFQTPFSNLSFDLKIPEHLENENIVWNGEVQEDYTYGDFQDEVEVVNRAFLEVMSRGDGYGNPFTFPLPTLNLTNELDWDSEEMWMWMALASKFGLPYFNNYIGTNSNPGTICSMCCRLLLNRNDLRARGIWDIKENTGSIGVVTVNMGQLGFLSRDENDFLTRLGELLVKAKEHLIKKREKVIDGFNSGLLPFTSHYLADFDAHFLTIGIVGMNEGCINLFGSDITQNAKFVIRVMEFIREKIGDFKRETGLLFNFEATPAEGCSHRLARIDRRKFGDEIFVQGDGDGVYYTNSTHIAVDSPLDLHSRIKIEEKFQKLYTGGTVFHIWLNEKPEVGALLDLTRRIARNTELPYFDFTPTYSICRRDGIIYGAHFRCPRCGRGTEVYSRITGYYRPISRWNDGKRREFIDRRSLA